jgi:hypothetical protein
MLEFPGECRSQPIWGARLGDVGNLGEWGGSLEVRDRGATTRIKSHSGEVPRVVHLLVVFDVFCSISRLVFINCGIMYLFVCFTSNTAVNENENVFIRIFAN